MEYENVKSNNKLDCVQKSLKKYDKEFFEAEKRLSDLTTEISMNVKNCIGLIKSITHSENPTINIFGENFLEIENQNFGLISNDLEILFFDWKYKQMQKRIKSILRTYLENIRIIMMCYCPFLNEVVLVSEEVIKGLDHLINDYNNDKIETVY